MNNDHFDFKDLMSFGMFILALLTFIFTFTEQCHGIEKPPSKLWRVDRVAFLCLLLRLVNPLWAVVLFFIVSIILPEVNTLYMNVSN